VSSGSAQIVKKAKIVDGYFSVYQEQEKPLPFIPFGWMPEQAPNMMNFDIGHQKEPHSGNTCIAVTIEWKFPWWAGIAWISEEKWELDDGSIVYDLTGAKRLVFFLKGKNGNERIQVKIGILWGRPIGDVIKKKGVKMEKPIESEWLTLTKKWEKYVIELEDYDLNFVQKEGGCYIPR